jgi:hypothetical protein
MQEGIKLNPNIQVFSGYSLWDSSILLIELFVSNHPDVFLGNISYHINSILL